MPAPLEGGASGRLHRVAAELQGQYRAHAAAAAAAAAAVAGRRRRRCHDGRQPASGVACMAAASRNSALGAWVTAALDTANTSGQCLPPRLASIHRTTGQTVSVSAERAGFDPVATTRATNAAAAVACLEVRDLHVALDVFAAHSRDLQASARVAVRCRCRASDVATRCCQRSGPAPRPRWRRAAGCRLPWTPWLFTAGLATCWWAGAPSCCIVTARSGPLRARANSEVIAASLPGGSGGPHRTIESACEWRESQSLWPPTRSVAFPAPPRQQPPATRPRAKMPAHPSPQPAHPYAVHPHARE